MNWNKVLNVLISLFLLVFMVLFAYQKIYEKDQYVISDSRLSQMEKVLNEKGISLYTYVPDYYPQSQLKLEAVSVSKQEVVERVLGDGPYQNSLDDEAMAEILKNSSGKMTFYFGEGQSGLIYYEGDPDNMKYVPEDMTDSNIEKTISQFAEDLFGEDVNMEATYWRKVDDGYRIEMNEKYKDELVFQSYIKIYITKDGIVEAQAIRYKPIEFVGGSQNIYPFDEIVYNLMYYLEEENGEETEDGKLEKTIRYIGIGYYLVDVDSRNLLYQADPYYRVIFDTGESYYINAFSNVIYDPNTSM